MSQLNPLNDLSRVYLDHVANTNQQNDAKDIKRWEEGNSALDKQMETSSQQLATLGAPQMEEGVSYVEAYVTELKKTTLGSYVSKASKDLSDRRFDQGDSEKRKYEPDEADDKEDKKLDKREQGIARAAKKLSKEEVVHEKVATGPRLGEPREKGATHMNAGEQEKISKRTKKWMGKQNPPIEGAPGSDAMKAREAEHQARRGVKKEETEVNEADSLAGQVSRWEAARQKRMKQRQSYERPHWIPKDQDHEDRYGSSKGVKVKKESLSNWRQDLIEIADDIPLTDTEAEKVVKEKKVNNKVLINPKMSEAVAQIGGEVISETQVELDEKHKDTPDQVKAVIAYDRARHATDDATYDTEHGKKKQAKKERDYAKWQRDTGARDAQKSGHPWEHEKYGTREKEGKKSVKHAHVKDSVEYILDNLHNLNEADIADILARLERKRIRQGGDPDESPLGKKTGRAMKDQQDKGRKKAGVSEGVLGTKAKGILGKEVKELEKASYTMKDTPVVKADKTDTPNYKGQKFGVKEADDWIQKAVKRPGAFTRKAKAAGMSVQQFAKHVDDNKSKYSTRTERQANLAQTFASMKKEDVEEMIFNYIAEDDRHIAWVEFNEGYQRNPEKGEKEDRKYERVRGERTPMPPRGNKRREEFERWYAANVR